MPLITAASAWVCVLAGVPPGDAHRSSTRRELVAVEVLFERVAGLDIGKASLTVYMRMPGPDGRRTLQSGFGRVITPDRRREHRWRDREPTGRGGIRAPTLIGFHCLVCGYLRPAETSRPPAPVCAGSKARTGKQHEPTPMQGLVLGQGASASPLRRDAT